MATKKQIILRHVDFDLKKKLKNMATDQDTNLNALCIKILADATKEKK